MSQATSWGVSEAGPQTPTAHAVENNDSLDAVLSQHSGATRPSYAVASTVWIDVVSATEENAYYFDGTDDILIYTINPTANTIEFSGLIIGADVAAFNADALFADVDDILTGGFAGTDDNDGTQSSGTYTPIYTGGNYKEIVNGGAFTFAPMANTSTLVVQITNNGSAGAITTSGWTIVTGDAFSTVNGDDFMCYLTVNNAFSHLHVVALQ